MKTEHRIIAILSIIIIISFAVIQTYSLVRTNDVFVQRNLYCISLGENITNSALLDESFITSCECRYENIIDSGMEAKCVCDCYTNGTVCPSIKNGRCYVSVMLTAAEDLNNI